MWVSCFMHPTPGMINNFPKIPYSKKAWGSLSLYRIDDKIFSLYDMGGDLSVSCKVKCLGNRIVLDSLPIYWLVIFL